MAKVKFIKSEYTCFDCKYFEDGYCKKHDLAFSMIPGSGPCTDLRRSGLKGFVESILKKR